MTKKMRFVSARLRDAALRGARRSWAQAGILAVLALGVRTAHADDIVEDPELAAVPHEKLVAPPPANGPHDTTWRITLHSRWGVDTDWTRPSQDIVQGTSVAVVEAEQRRSDTLLLSVGLRARHGFAAHQSGAARYELDLAPVSLFADVTPAAGFHVRAGYQVISMGRFDLFSATNFLSVLDLRSGPVTMTEASAIAQPALRFDLDRFRGFTLQAYYVPFFEPHLIAGYGSDYSVYSILDRQGGFDATRSVLERAFTRSGLTTTSTGVLQALAPAPDLRSPQGAVRATMYGSAGEVSATVGTALEPLPTLVASPALTAFLANPGIVIPQAEADALANQPIRVEHLRYGIASMDAALDAGPIQLGAEAAYMLGRTLLGVRPDRVPLPAMPTAADRALATPERADMAQFGLRGEMVEAAGWAAEVETFFGMALRNPSDPSLRWLGLDAGRYTYGVAVGGHYAPDNSRLRFEFGGAAMSIATYVIMPRIEWRALTAFFLELGGVFVQGRKPGPLGTPNVSFGGLYNDVDQVFVGARWSP